MRRFLLPAILTGLVSCQQSTEPPPPVDTVVQKPVRTLVHNARIYTMDLGNSLIAHGAMAIAEDGEILAIGENQPMVDAFSEADQIDLGGRTILPGLIDTHGHLSGLAQSFTRANLVGTRNKTEVMQRLRDFERDLPVGDWLLGRGWDQNDWPEQAFPDRHDLDAQFPDRPVWLIRIDGHAAWGNSAALAQADRDLSGDWQLEGGFVHRDAAGNATGIFIDGARSLVESVIPEISADTLSAALDLATQRLVSLGLTAVHDPGIDRATMELYREKILAGRFPLRVYAMADGMNATLDWLCANGPVEDSTGRLAMRSVKLYGDGALGSRGAALLADYSDEAGSRGLLFAQQQVVEDNMRRILDCGLQIGIHAIGDAANRQALDALETVLPEYPDNPGRHRIEHAQVLHPDDLLRFADLDVIAAMQPTHATSDMYWAEERLGQERLAGAYAWKSLLESGARLSFGSDFPVEEVNPMLGIHAAVTRRDAANWPQGGWLPQERLTREEAIRAFTFDAAYSGFMEDRIGSLEVGKRADFIVLEHDIMQVPAEQIHLIRVLQTWLDGKKVFDFEQN